MTRTKPAEQRRAELLAAGQALFLAKGIAGTSLDDITQRAGVSKGLFYLYFPSKEDLVLALREQFSRELAERMRAAAAAVPVGVVPAGAVPVSAGSGWADRLDACVRAGFECYRELHDLHEVLFHHARVAPPGPGKSGEPGSGPLDPAPAPVARVIRELLAAGRRQARSTCPTRNPPRCCATRACTPSTTISAAGRARMTPGSSGPRSCCSAAPPGCPERASRRDATRRRDHEAPGSRRRVLNGP